MKIIIYDWSISLCRELGDRDGEGVILAQLGDAYSAAGAVEAARQTWQHALAILDVTHRFDAEPIRAKLTALDHQP